jgi:DNA-binding IclR family transcriptional regulator
MLDKSWIREEGFKHIYRLAKKTQLISRLALWDGNRAVGILSVDPCAKPVVVRESEIDIPGYCSALGRTFLAFLTDEELNAYLEKVEWISYTDNTIVEKTALLKQLELVRKMGYSSVQEETTYGIARLAAPVFGSSGCVEAAVGISGASENMQGNRMRKLISMVLNTAKEISWITIIEGFDREHQVISNSQS